MVIKLKLVRGPLRIIFRVLGLHETNFKVREPHIHGNMELGWGKSNNIICSYFEASVLQRGSNKKSSHGFKA
jgi:hypothetical protein